MPNCVSVYVCVQVFGSANLCMYQSEHVLLFWCVYTSYVCMCSYFCNRNTILMFVLWSLFAIEHGPVHVLFLDVCIRV